MSEKTAFTTSAAQTNVLDAAEPAHRQVYMELRNQILSRKKNPGDKLATEVELMKQFEVSRITVRRAFQELATEGLVIGIKGKGTFVSDIRCSIAHKFLFVQSADSVVTPYTYRILDGFQKENHEDDAFRMEFLNLPSAQLQSVNDTTIEEFVEHGRFDGVVTVTDTSSEQLARLTAANVPVICIGRQVRPVPEAVVFVGPGAKTSFEIAVEELQAIGRKEIGIIAHHAMDGDTENKIIDCMKNVGLRFRWETFERTDWGLNYGLSAAQRLLRRCPEIDAIIGGDDLHAIGILHAAYRMGVKVPDQLAIVGSGNFMGEHSHAGISTVDTRLFEIGQNTVRCLRRMIAGEKCDDVSLSPRFIKRETT